jgi:hypothetical protein
MFVANVNGRCVETCANIKLSFFLHVLILLKKNIQYYGTWCGFDRGGFAAMVVNPTYLHIYDNEFDDEEADENHFEKPWVVDMCKLMRFGSGLQQTSFKREARSGKCTWDFEKNIS